MTRREFLAASAAPLTLSDTVLVHEHILVDFIGAGRIRPGRYDPDEVFRIARGKLLEVQRLGCRRFLECTPAFIGRAPRLLARLSDATGIEIWTNTGIYGAADHKFVPAFARTQPAAKLARRWIQEWRRGVDGAKPRFIKTGVSRAPLDELDRKLVRAAALTSRETGLPIASHTSGGGPAALEQLEILASEKVPAERFVWVHAHSEKDHSYHGKVGRLGAWVEFDGIQAKSVDWHLECLRFMAEQNLLHRVLISQDAGWYHVGEPGGGVYRSYAFIYTDFLPRLAADIARQLMAVNPLRAFR